MASEVVREEFMSCRKEFTFAIFGLLALLLMGCGIATPVTIGPQTFQSALLSVSNQPFYDYGFVQVGNLSDHMFTVNNIGQITATDMASSFHLSLHFKYKGGSFPGTGGTCADELDPTDSCLIVISFEPQFNGSFQDLITIDYHNGLQMTSTDAPIIKGSGFGGPPGSE
jgi:hypothetical protein